MQVSMVVLADQSLAALDDAVVSVRESSRRAAGAARADMIAAALRAADELTAVAVDLIGRGDLEAATGLSTEGHLMLEARRTGSESRILAQAASTLRSMPSLARAFRDGLVSWGQVRAITCAVTRIDAAGRDAVDLLVAEHASALAGADPDRLIEIVDHEVARRRPDLMLAREDRAIEGSFLAIQGRLDGRSTLYGEADAESTATIVQALDAAADRPTATQQDDPRSRARQRFDALVSICEDALAGGAGGAGGAARSGARPRPRFLAVLDVAALIEESADQALSLLWDLPGRAPRLTGVSHKTLICDSTIVPILMLDGAPVAVGDASHVVADKVRAALAARDGGCRFPGCSAPASWCDAHHIVPGRGNQACDLVLLCRRCHRRVHRLGWRIRPLEGGAIEFTRRGRTLTSYPRVREPLPRLE